MPSLHESSMLSIVILCLCSFSLLSCAERSEEPEQPSTTIVEGDTAEENIGVMNDTSGVVLKKKDRFVVIVCHANMVPRRWSVSPTTTEAFKKYRIGFLLIGAEEATVDLTSAKDYIDGNPIKTVKKYTGQADPFTFFEIKSGGPAAPAQPYVYGVKFSEDCGEQIDANTQALTSPGMIVKE